MGPIFRAGAAAIGCALLMCGCSTTSAPSRAAPAAVVVRATPGLSENERLTLAIALLNHGDREQARAELEAAGSSDPRAARLLSEMEENPQTALGLKGFAYTARPGDTMVSIASRFLGDPLKFYLLARYNGMAQPDSLTPGQVLMIPGEAPRPEERGAAATSVNVQRPSVIAPAARGAQPAEARRLRILALEAMDRGQINRAVQLLQQAEQLDPNDALIKRDLGRAQRIAMTVHGR